MAKNHIQDGEKKDIVKAIEKTIANGNLELKCDFKLLKKIPKEEFKERFLFCSSWHHTSSHYNKTDFFSVDYEYIGSITNEQITEILEKSKNKETKTEEEYWQCKFLVWGGTKHHPKATEVIEDGMVKGEWFYRKDGTKKKTTANGFEFLKKLEKVEK